MIKATIDGIKDLSKLQKQVENWDKEVTQLNGRVIDLKREPAMISGPILHQDSDQMTEEESAKYERDNPELVRFLQSLKEKLDRMIAG